jgi:restriction system protein
VVAPVEWGSSQLRPTAAEEAPSFRSASGFRSSDKTGRNCRSWSRISNNIQFHSRFDFPKKFLLSRRAEAPTVFERIVIELLVKMGYGGSRADAAQAIGKPGDEGLDGFIKEDRLGLDIIYVQAKRWAATVGRPEIQKFAGALHGQHATKGIFITTSDFSRDATDYVSKIGSKIVLIDGSRLAELMIEFGVAVATDATYTVKRIDNDFFESI